MFVFLSDSHIDFLSAKFNLKTCIKYQDTTHLLCQKTEVKQNTVAGQTFPPNKVFVLLMSVS